MTSESIDNVTVIGAGTMGHGIAEVVALAGYAVTLQDIDEDALAEGYGNIEWSLEKLEESGAIDDAEEVAAHISTDTDADAAIGGADVVLEAVPEDLDLKQSIFETVDGAADDGALLATNTSSLSITDIASVTDRPEDVVGTHFFNPPVKMDLVEVVYGDETSDETARRALDFVESLGKTPIEVREDIFGFVVNNILHEFVDEPAWMVSRGEATIREADAAMVHQRGYPMGPFELADLAGIDVAHGVREAGNIPVPPVMQERVDAGEYGRKTGVGYYNYEDGKGADYEPGDGAGFDTLHVEACMANAAAELLAEDVTTVEDIDTGMRLGAGFPEGICERADAIGLGTIVRKLRTLHDTHGDDRYEPSRYLLDLVEAGNTGTATGAGFYDYGDEETGDADVGLPGSDAYDELNYELSDDGLLAIELNRPEEMNAFGPPVRAELDDLLSSIDIDDVACVTVEGAGDKAFCAGADINRFGDRKPTDWMDVTEIIERVADYPRPTIAKIQGYCLGAGLELALACDMRIATTNSQFGFPEIGLGLIPGGGGTQRAVRLLGDGRAKELVFRGSFIDGERAADWGLVNRAVADDALEDEVSEFLEDIIPGPPIALRVAKRVIDDGPDASLDTALAMESQGFGLLMGTDDVGEGIAAFQEHREAEFRGE